jgi:hypothetical protein
VKFGIAARQVHQIVGVNHQWMQVVFLAQAGHLLALRAGQLVRLPLSRAGRKNLERVATQAVRTFRRIGHASRGRGVNPDAPRGELGRPLGRGQQFENVLFFLSGIGHSNILSMQMSVSPGPTVGVMS